MGAPGSEGHGGHSGRLGPYRVKADRTVEADAAKLQTIEEADQRL